MSKRVVFHMAFVDPEGGQPGDPLCWCGDSAPQGMTNVWHSVTCTACRIAVLHAADEGSAYNVPRGTRVDNVE